VFVACLLLPGSQAAATEPAGTDIAEGAEAAAGFARYGVDYSTINNVDWPVYFAELKAAGRDFVGRYLPVEGAMWRRVTTAELDAATAAGIDYFFWFENSTALRCLDGFDAGVEDAREALSALASLDLPATTPVYYTVDMNLGDGSRIDAYFRGIGSVVPGSQVGVYGNYTAVDWVYQHGLATYFCQTNAWSDARGWHPQAQMHQDVTQHMIGGLYVDRLSVTAADFGQCRRREQSDPRIFRAGAWEKYVKTLASGGSYGRANTSKASATIYFTGTRLDWIAMKGTTAGSADVYLDGTKKATINLAASTASYRVKVWSTGALAYGNHKVEIVRSTSSATGKYVTLDAVDVVGSLSALLPPTVTALTPSSGSTSGGTSVTITGTGFTDVSAVTFGGAPAATFTVHSPTQITALTSAHAQGAVNVSVIAHGWANGNTSKDDYTYSDTSLATRFEQTDPHIVYEGAWETYIKTVASGGSYGRANTSKASATIYFTGTRLDWIAMKGITAGSADVYLDGTKKATVNLAASTASYRVKVWSTGVLANGRHSVRIVRSASSAATKYVNLDAIEVLGTITGGP
jgi:Rv2525c-like, glycoside hydrolase-like domain/IPT/TIG domain